VKNPDISENLVKKAYLALGSNLGNKKKNLELAKYQLNLSGINILNTSKYYKTKSWPNKKFPDFYNLLLLVKTKLSLVELFKKIKFIEKNLGRKKSPKNHPRVCDIDIIDFNNECRNISYFNKKIIVPHESLDKRNFVLIPLFEINKSWIHPKSKKNIVKLISSLSTNDLRSIKIV
tara:strand:+ start:634 stop:1161 length:528 start_codon:yes stop_codon:yes gene_type:complete